MVIYSVHTSNIDGECLFCDLQDALNFIADQIEMGFSSTLAIAVQTECDEES